MVSTPADRIGETSMMDGRFRKLGARCAFAVGPLLLWCAASLAQSTNSDSEVDALVANIKNYYIDCHSIDTTDTGQARKCSDEKNGLLGRQKALGVSNDTINNKLSGGVTLRGGWRWPN